MPLEWIVQCLAYALKCRLSGIAVDWNGCTIVLVWWPRRAISPVTCDL